MKNRLCKVLNNVLLAGFLSVVAVSSTGCMLTPGDGEVFHRRSSVIDVSGATMTPGEQVKIQARNPGGGNWVTLANAETTVFVTPMFGTDYYMFAEDVVVPNNLWSWDAAARKYKTEVRTINETNGTLLTFEGEFELYLWDYDIADPAAAAEIWTDHGAGTTVTIFANNG